jgi:hypothetical protein
MKLHSGSWDFMRHWFSNDGWRGQMRLKEVNDADFSGRLIAAV